MSIRLYYYFINSTKANLIAFKLDLGAVDNKNGTKFVFYKYYQ